MELAGCRIEPTANAAATAPGVDDGLDLEAFVDGASHVFGAQGYSRLALWLSAAGWRERGSGLFEELAQAIAGARSRGRRRSPGEEERFLAALVALATMAEPVFGGAALRSVSLPGDAATSRRFRRWLARTFDGLAKARPPGPR